MTATVPSPRVIALGLDSLSLPLIRRWLGEGHLPGFQRLLDQGVLGRLQNPPGLSGAAWPSCYTGTNPARHGHYFYTQIKPGTYRTEVLPPGFMATPPIWERLSRLGHRVAVLDAPKTHASKAINGVLLCDWATHDPDGFHGLSAQPPGFAAEVRDNYPPDPLRSLNWGDSGPADFGAFAAGVVENIRRRQSLLMDVLGRESWDLLFSGIDDAHRSGHLCWHLSDSDHPYYDPGLLEQIEEPLLTIYRAMDELLVAVLERIGPDTRLLVFSPVGMGPNYCLTPLLTPFIRNQAGSTPGAREKGHSRLKALWDQMPLALQKYLFRFKHTFREHLLASTRRGWEAFTLPINEDCGAIRINLKGREPAGLVAPGSDYDAVLERLTSAIQGWRSPLTDQPLVRRIERTDKICSGPFLDQMPDLLVEWRNEEPLTEIATGPGQRAPFEIPPRRTGSHTGDGFFVAWKQGVDAKVLPAAFDVTSIAPTLMNWLGHDCADMDGEPIALFPTDEQTHKK